MFDFQAHRGGRDARPENTLYSYLYGMEIGANIECDMQLARDGIVMSHNPVLNPDITRDIHGSYLRTGIYDIRLMTIEEIKSFDVGAINPESEYFGLHGSQTALHAKIPTLEEMFQLAVDTGHNTTEFNIETKSYPDPQSPFYENNADQHKFVDEFLRIVRKYKMEKRVILQSFDWRTLRIMKDEAPEIRTSALYQLSPDSPVDGDTIHMTRREPSPWLAGLSIHDYDGHIAACAYAAGADILSPNFREFTEKDAYEAHELGMKILPWTVNSRNDMLETIEKGADGIISDRPWILRELLERRGIPLRPLSPSPESPYHIEGTML